MATISFEEFLEQVNLYLLRNFGVTSGDLPDYCYRDAYDDGIAPSECAQQVASEAW